MPTLYHAFEEAAHRFSQKTALLSYHTGQHLTYRQLLQSVQGCIIRLQTKYHVLPGQRVGLLMNNQPEFIVAFFALQALGAVVVPLNYRLTSYEQRIIFEDAAITGLVASTDYQEIYTPLLNLLDWVIEVDLPEPTGNPAGLSPLLAAGQDSDLTPPPVLPDCSGDSLAVLIYTSGTTGQPKGVMLSHHNLIADATANAEVIAATAQDVFVTASPLFHVFGLTNIMLTALFQGSRIVLIRRFSPTNLLEAISRHQVTFLAAVPTMYQMMLSLLPNAAYDLSSLRVCHSGAAPMPVAVFQQVETLFGAPVQEGYGQSEASSIITSNPLEGPRKPGSIGKPLPGVTLEVVDEADQVLPPGQVGEIRVQGATVMRGYLNKPEATAQALRNGWLYTSDLAYTDAEGYIFLMGRRDDLMNIGGTKVYPQEIEEVLYQHPTVQACAVTAEASELYYQTIAAYVVLKPNQTITPPALQQYCRAKLGEHKVPKNIYLVQDIPKGATGKILRHQLRPPTRR